MRKFLHFLLWTVAILGAVIGLGRAFAIRWIRVPNDLVMAASVEPTLEGGDLILLWRLTAPAFGNLVVCPDPDNAGQVVIGRIVAEAGDTIEIAGDLVTVNGQRSETEMACDDFVAVDPNTQTEVEQRCSVEVLGTHKHTIGQTSAQKNVPKPVKDEVMAGEAYLVSDNRLFPYDSRDYRAVQRSACPEAVVFRLVGRNGWGDAAKRLSFIR